MPDSTPKSDYLIKVLTVSAAAIVVVASAIVINAFANSDVFRELKWSELSAPPRDSLLYGASCIILVLISYMSASQIREVMIACRGNRYRSRANNIAIVIALVLTIFLFKQPFLDRLFAGKSTDDVVSTILFGGGVTTGWLVWYLRIWISTASFFMSCFSHLWLGFVGTRG